MATIFKKNERKFEENPGRIDGFRLMSEVSVSAKNAETKNLKFDLRQLNPGEYSSLYHFHRNAEELFMIVSGAATLRTPEGLLPVENGDIVFFETGETGAHQMYNHTGEPCVYLDIRTFAGCDIAEYPDSERLMIIPSAEQFRKDSRTGYFDGEAEKISGIWDELRKK